MVLGKGLENAGFIRVNTIESFSGVTLTTLDVSEHTRELLNNQQESEIKMKPYRAIISETDKNIINLFPKLLNYFDEEDDIEAVFDAVLNQALQKDTVKEGGLSRYNDLIELLKIRFNAVEEVGKIKHVYKIPPHQPGRWKIVEHKAAELGDEKGESCGEYVRVLWPKIHTVSLAIEDAIKSGNY